MGGLTANRELEPGDHDCRQAEIRYVVLPLHACIKVDRSILSMISSSFVIGGLFGNLIHHTLTFHVSLKYIFAHFFKCLNMKNYQYTKQN